MKVYSNEENGRTKRWQWRSSVPTRYEGEGGHRHAGLLVQERSPCGVGLPPLHGASLRIAEFILRNEGPEARGKGFLAFSLKSAAGGRFSNLHQGNSYPRTHHSIIPVFQHSIIPLFCRGMTVGTHPPVHYIRRSLRLGAVLHPRRRGRFPGQP